MSEERIINLEIKYSHQEAFIEELNKIITDQQKAIERLEKAVLDLKRNINSLGGVDATRPLSEDKPPHY